MLKAFRYGAPPHGGSAPGIDRIVMLLADTPNIREIVAFPMNQQAEDLLMQAPGPGAARAPEGTAHPPRPAAAEGAVVTGSQCRKPTGNGPSPCPSPRFAGRGNPVKWRVSSFEVWRIAPPAPSSPSYGERAGVRGR